MKVVISHYNGFVNLIVLSGSLGHKQVYSRCFCPIFLFKKELLFTVCFPIVGSIKDQSS